MTAKYCPMKTKRTGTIYSSEYPSLSGEVFVGRWLEPEEYDKTPSGEVSFVGQADETSSEGVSGTREAVTVGQVLARPQAADVPQVQVPVGSRVGLPATEAEAAGVTKRVSGGGWRRLARWVGWGLTGLSLLGLGLMFTPLVVTEVKYRVRRWSQLPRAQVEYRSGVDTIQGRAERFGQLLARQVAGPDYSQVVPSKDFSLIVPKINARSKVIANVDPGDERAYMAALKQGVAHAAGTVFPGMKGNIFLFAHSTDSPLNITRYNAEFYLLRELEPGDEVQVYYLGKEYNYRVYDKQVLPADDVSYLQRQEEEERLILQTCWPPGTTWKRLVVLARPV